MKKHLYYRLFLLLVLSFVGFSVLASEDAIRRFEDLLKEIGEYDPKIGDNVVMLGPSYLPRFIRSGAKGVVCGETFYVDGEGKRCLVFVEKAGRWNREYIEVGPFLLAKYHGVKYYKKQLGWKQWLREYFCC